MNNQVFYFYPTDAQLDCSKRVKIYIKIYIKMLLRVSVLQQSSGNYHSYFAKVIIFKIIS